MKNKKRLIFFLALSLAVCSGCAIRPDSGAGQEKYTFAPEQKEEDSNSKTEEEPEDTEYIPVDIEEKQNEEETEEKMAAEGQTADTKTESIPVLYKKKKYTSISNIDQGKNMEKIIPRK